MYHRISDDRDELAVSPRRFREQMEFLAAEGYRVCDVPDVATRLAAGELPQRTVGLSFDDGYRDVAENALPVLAEYGYRATVFVATGVTDGTGDIRLVPSTAASARLGRDSGARPRGHSRVRGAYRHPPKPAGP